MSHIQMWAADKVFRTILKWDTTFLTHWNKKNPDDLVSEGIIYFLEENRKVRAFLKSERIRIEHKRPIRLSQIHNDVTPQTIAEEFSATVRANPDGKLIQPSSLAFPPSSDDSLQNISPNDSLALFWLVPYAFIWIEIFDVSGNSLSMSIRPFQKELLSLTPNQAIDQT